MPNMLSRRTVLGAALLGPVGLALPVRAADPSPERLALRSAYTGKVLVDGARRVGLSATLDATGTGSGTLTLDPNLTDGKTSTLIAVQEIPVRLRPVQDDGRAGKGRRLYELTRTGPEGKAEAGGPRWFLVRPVEPGNPCWLVFADADGKFHDVLALE